VRERRGAAGPPSSPPSGSPSKKRQSSQDPIPQPRRSAARGSSPGHPEHERHEDQSYPDQLTSNPSPRTNRADTSLPPGEQVDVTSSSIVACITLVPGQGGTGAGPGTRRDSLARRSIVSSGNRLRVARTFARGERRYPSSTSALPPRRCRLPTLPGLIRRSSWRRRRRKDAGQLSHPQRHQRCPPDAGSPARVGRAKRSFIVSDLARMLLVPGVEQIANLADSASFMQCAKAPSTRAAAALAVPAVCLPDIRESRVPW